MTIHIDEQIREVQRELALRKNVYPGLVTRGRMKPDAMDRRIEVMQAVLQSLFDIRAWMTRTGQVLEEFRSEQPSQDIETESNPWTER